MKTRVAGAMGALLVTGGMIFGGAGTALAQDVPPSRDYSSTVGEKAADVERQVEKQNILAANSGFQKAAAEGGITTRVAAVAAAEYLSYDQVIDIAHQLDPSPTYIPELDASTPIPNQIEPRIAPWNLDCGKAWAGYLAYQAQGIAVCAPFAIATGGFGGFLCQIVKAGVGSHLDFNKLC